MNATNKLLDKFASACSVRQDKELAARLRVTKSAVSNWRNGRAHPDAASVARMCEATGETIAHWLPLIQAERTRSPADRKVWLRLAQAAAALILAAGLTPSGGHATDAGNSARNPCTLYIMSTIAQVAQAVGTILAAMRRCFAWRPGLAV